MKKKLKMSGNFQQAFYVVDEFAAPFVQILRRII